MKNRSKTPEQAMQAIITGFVKTKQTDKGVRQAQKRHQKAEHNLREAVNAYNLAIAEQIIAALISEGLGLCEQRFSSNKFHIVTEAELMGVVLTGTRTTGDHYYERDEHYVETYLKCKTCRDKMNLRRGYDSLVELDVRANWIKKLKEKFIDLYSIGYVKDILEWAAERGITALPITRQYSQGEHFRLGDSVLSYKPYNHWGYY